MHQLAAEVQAQVGHLDVLINNAGVYLTEKQLTVDGYEMTFAVNHLAPFLLTNLLLSALKASAPARVVTVSSVAHGSARWDWENLNAEKKFHSWGAYCISKLGNLLFTFALSRRLEGSGVTANALHPGVVNTRMSQQLKLEGKPVEQGAETPIYLASSPEATGVNGEYFSQKRVAQPSEMARDEALQEKFWAVSRAMVGLGTD